MEDDLIMAEDFFDDSDTQKWTPLVRASDHKVCRKGLTTFEDVKVKVVMQIEGCGREEAVRIIEKRSAVLRAKEKTRGDSGRAY